MRINQLFFLAEDSLHHSHCILTPVAIGDAEMHRGSNMFAPSITLVADQLNTLKSVNYFPK